MEQKKLKPWHGVVSFAVMMIIFVLVAIPVQGKLGLIGVGITELLLLAMAIAVALIFKQNLKEVFPVKLPKLREVLGLLIFFAGGYIATIAATAALTVLFPEEVLAVSDGLNDVLTSKGIWLSLLIASVMPAICEEAVHRGFILHTFKGVKKQWVIVLSMGIIFGVFHLDPFRFIPTAILGACMTWVMLKTKNMVLPSLFHGFNNLFPVLINFAMKGITESVTTADGVSATAVATFMESGWVMKLGSIGVYMMFFLAAFPLMLAGTALMKPKGEKIKGKHVATVFIISGACFAIGLIMVIAASVSLVAQGVGV